MITNDNNTMSFGGSVSAMITTLKNNARERNTIFDRKNRAIRKGNKKRYVTDKKATTKQLHKIRKRIKKENRLKAIKAIFLTLLILVIIRLLIFFL